MGRSSQKRYKSYKDRKSQSKKFRSYFIRVFLIIVIYAMFTTFIAISISVSDNTMEPIFKSGNSLLVQPFRNIKVLSNNKKINRGEIVLTKTNYAIETTALEKILDPIVRVFTLQYKSLIYSNENRKGRSEILRVVGLPGDRIKIKDNIVYIKSVGSSFYLSEFELSKKDYDITRLSIDEAWKKDFPFSSEMEDITVPENCYFLISDNRDVLNDSRIFGCVDQSKILGKILLKYWPVNEFTIF